MTTRYEDGFLPGPGGWLDQDFLFAVLIREGLNAKRERERVEQRRQQMQQAQNARRR